MVRRKELKSVAESIADKFVSRYNDIGGYWTIGKIYRFLDTQETTEFTYDIIDQTSTPTYGAFDEIDKPYAQMLVSQCQNKGFCNMPVGAKVILSFESENIINNGTMKKTGGRSFLCTVVIEDDIGQLWSGQRRDWCWKHQPELEIRSTRYDPQN